MIRIEPGDCTEVMARLKAEGVQVDSVVCDPPYHLTAGGSRGFMNKEWDGGDVAFQPDTWRLAFDLLKPGGHLVAFSGTRTYHRMAAAIEDAGFEIRDQLAWVYGSGFPKSHDVAKGIDKAAGAEREVVGLSVHKSGISNKHGDVGGKTTWDRVAAHVPLTAPATESAKQWEGWGTALKPAWEPVVLARKPLIGTVAENVLQHGTGAINVDACRVGTSKNVPASPKTVGASTHTVSMPGNTGSSGWDPNIGRWPANIVHDGSDEVLAAFPESGPASDKPRHNGDFKSSAKGYEYAHTTHGHADNGGSAARFFYTAKADAEDRLGSKHPTVKPVSLMRWLVRMVTPPGGLVLDPFAGTGTTGMACIAEKFRAILIEREEEYLADIKRRIEFARGEGPLAQRATMSRFDESKAKGDDTPLFSGAA